MLLDKGVSQSYQFSDYTYASHRKIIDFVGSKKKVLDAGCNKGYLSKRFKENECFVVGIEKDLENARIAREFCNEILINDIEEIENLPYPENYFDVIVFADILEHLKIPDKVLVIFKRYLNTDGFIIVSLPNIARLDIRLKLLFGKFNYQESGILDKSHLRFFTISTAKKLLLECGYKIIDIDYSGLMTKFRILPTCFAFQFIIVAKKS